MGFKTYLPGLLKIMNSLCNYMQKYEVQIKNLLSDDQKAAFDTLLAACKAFQLIYPAFVPGD